MSHLPARRSKRWLRSIAAVFALLLALGALAVLGWHFYDRPLTMASERIEVRVAAGASARSIAHELRAAGVDVDELQFVAAARATGATKALRAGRYAIERGASIRAVVEQLRRGDVLRERLTIVEGWTFGELREALAQYPELKHDTAAWSDAQVLRAIGAAETDPEGLFAPDTYVFDTGSSDLEVYRQAYRMQAERLEQAWQSRASSLPYKTPYEALIMASIVEKETGSPDERRRVAAVFVNRQRLGMPLQTDPTVIYGLGERYDGRLHKRDLQRDTPYNTYTRAGLPPTPISLPGRAAIEAALNPDSTRALYFVARGDGSSEFSETLAAHNRAVDRFQRAGTGVAK